MATYLAHFCIAQGNPRAAVAIVSAMRGPASSSSSSGSGSSGSSRTFPVEAVRVAAVVIQALVRHAGAAEAAMAAAAAAPLSGGGGIVGGVPDAAACLLDALELSRTVLRDAAGWTPAPDPAVQAAYASARIRLAQERGVSAAGAAALESDAAAATLLVPPMLRVPAQLAAPPQPPSSPGLAPPLPPVPPALPRSAWLAALAAFRATRDVAMVAQLVDHGLAAAATAASWGGDGVVGAAAPSPVVIAEVLRTLRALRHVEFAYSLVAAMWGRRSGADSASRSSSASSSVSQSKAEAGLLHGASSEAIVRPPAPPGTLRAPETVDTPLYLFALRACLGMLDAAAADTRAAAGAVVAAAKKAGGSVSIEGGLRPAEVDPDSVWAVAEAIHAEHAVFLWRTGGGSGSSSSGSGSARRQAAVARLRVAAAAARARLLRRADRLRDASISNGGLVPGGAIEDDEAGGSDRAVALALLAATVDCCSALSAASQQQQQQQQLPPVTLPTSTRRPPPLLLPRAYLVPALTVLTTELPALQVASAEGLGDTGGGDEAVREGAADAWRCLRALVPSGGLPEAALATALALHSLGAGGRPSALPPAATAAASTSPFAYLEETSSDDDALDDAASPRGSLARPVASESRTLLPPGRCELALSRAAGGDSVSYAPSSPLGSPRSRVGLAAASRAVVLRIVETILDDSAALVPAAASAPAIGPRRSGPPTSWSLERLP